MGPINMKLIRAARNLEEVGTKAINASKAVLELAKLGTARAGSGGAITEDEKHYYTGCGRLAQARLLGFERPPSTSLLAMFEGGLALENFLEKIYLAAGLEFKKEQPISGQIGRTVISGRPDFDLNIDGRWVGVEVKSMASPFSAIKQAKNGYPLIKHLVQACTYMLLSEREEWLVAVGNIFFANERGFRVNPGVRYYEVHKVQSGGGFTVTNEQDKTAPLPFTARDIERYYNRLIRFTGEEKLMARPSEFELKSDTYSRCKYCAMASACNEIENGQIDFTQWMKKVPEAKE